MTCFHAGMSILMMISRKYNAMSARVLAICVVLILLIPMQEKFLVTDVAKWVILVCHVVDHVEKQRKLPIMGHLAYAISAVKEDTLHVNASPLPHRLAYATSVEEEDTLLANAVLLRLVKEIVNHLLLVKDLVEKIESSWDTSLHLMIMARSTKGKR